MPATSTRPVGSTRVDRPGTVQSTTTPRWPSPALRVACIAWPLGIVVLARVLDVAEPGARSIWFHVACWPPLLAMLVPLAWRHPTAPWRLMAFGVLCFGVASGTESVARYKDLTEPSDLSASDPLFVLGYALLLGGLAMLLRRYGRTDLRSGLVDMAVALVPSGVLLYQYVVVPVAAAADPWYVRLVVGLYPFADVVALLLLVWLVATPALTRVHLGALLAGMTLSLVADLLLAIDVLDPDSVLRYSVESIYPISFALLAVGVATGATTRVGPTDVHQPVHWGRVWMLGLGAVMAPLTVVVDGYGDHRQPSNAILVAAVVTMCLIVLRMVGLARLLQDTTNQLAAAKAELQRQAIHDPLTGLLNRAVLDELLEALADPTARPAALLSIDLDRFKEVNDRYGHAAGDEVLEVVARRMRHVVRTDDHVIRMGGDEFLVVLARVQRAEVAALAERLVHHIETPIEWEDHVLAVSASVGVAHVAAGEALPRVDELVASADAAMYAAKHAGSGQVRTAPGRGAALDVDRPTRATVGAHDDRPGEQRDSTDAAPLDAERVGSRRSDQAG